MTKITIYPLDLLDKFERVFTILSLLLYMNAVIPLLITQGASEGDGIDIQSFNFTPLNLLFLTNYFVTVLLLLLRWNKSIYSVLRNLTFIGLVLMAPISYLWSVMPEETLSGSIGLIGSTMFGFYVASRFSLKDQLQLIGWAFGLSLILSAIFVVALPKYGIMAAIHAGSLRGVWTHKNVMGKYMVLSNCVFLLLVQSCKNNKKYAWLGLFGSIFLTIGSNSTNALVNSILAAIIILFLSRAFRLKNNDFAMVFALLILFIWGVSACFNDIATILLESVGKDPTLTGRTDIWNVVIDKIHEKPWLGYGFKGFWHGIQGESADVIRALRWDVPNSHNGYLDFILQLGILGFALFIVIYWSTLIKAYLLARKEFRIEYLWPIVFLIYLVQINFAEPSLLSQNDFFWIIFTIVTCSVSLEFKQVFSRSSSSHYDSIAVCEIR